MYLRTSRLLCGVAICALVVNGMAPIASAQVAADSVSNDGNTTTPIKHVIVLIGENRTFDHVFATYKPKHGQSVSNLLSKGIINASRPTRNFALLRTQSPAAGNMHRRHNGRLTRHRKLLNHC